MKHIAGIAPKTPQLVYTNTSNLYLELLTDWLSYADSKGLSREAAFYHAVAAKPYRGDSPSSRPVNWFWGVYKGAKTLTDLTSAAHSTGGRVSFGGAGESLYLGYPERFREINVNLATARPGWAAVLEYCTATDATGQPTTWAPLTKRSDTTAGLTRDGQIVFDPPTDWKTAVVSNPARLFYVRFRTTAGATPPVAGNLLGRDYVSARGTTSGVIPAFDFKADLNKDGYLDDAEYAQRAAGKDARFVYESRLVPESYGQMRFPTNPSNAGFRQWAVDYHLRLLAKVPLAGGLFMDNSEGKLPVNPADVLEPVQNFAGDYGAMLNAIGHAIAPRWVLANTAGGQSRADPVIQQSPAYFEEFAIRPLAHHYVYFEDLAATIAHRATLASPPPLAVIDSHPQGGSPTDPRMLLATLAYYYLLADPQSTFLMCYGGHEPASTWKRHWTPAAAFDIGQPSGKFSQFATGTDPSNHALQYRVYQRSYDKALVLYKPLSYARGVNAKASLGDATATKHDLKGTYRPLLADGTLGAPLTSVTLRNGEGAILIRVGP
jgi:hypothetical protein